MAATPPARPGCGREMLTGLRERGRAPGHSRYEVHIRRVRCRPDPATAYQQLFADGRHSFWLDSGAGSGPTARFSYLGGGGPLHEYVTYRVADRAVTVRRPGAGPGAAEVAEVVNQRFFDYLDAELRRRVVPAPPGLPFDFHLGYVGYLGYELRAETGGTGAHAADSPDAALLFTDRLLVVDHAAGDCYLLALSAGDPRPATEWLAEATATITAAATIDHADSPELTGPAYSGPGMTDPTVRGLVSLRHDRSAYLALVRESLDLIRRGESQEICLTNAATVHARVDPLPAYRHLRRISPVPYGALLRFPEVAVLSASPERFLRVGPDRVVESRPIKGTRPRGATPAEDAALRRDLHDSPKDRTENLLTVAVVRRDLQAVCAPGSVHAPHLCQVETYPPAHQLVSTVRGVLRPGASIVDCVRAAFPAGSMTGAPKLRTMEIIDRLEQGPRGVYAGALGWFSLSGPTDLSVVIRTLVVAGERVTFGVGGAVVAGSDPAAEFEETVVKSRAMLAAVQAAGIVAPGPS